MVMEGASFSIKSKTCSNTLEAGKTCVVIMQFSSDKLGSYGGTLKVFTDNGTTIVSLQGSVVGQKSIAVSPSVLDFGIVPVGATHERELVITNDGDVDVTITGVEGIYDPFSVESVPAEPLAPGETATLTVSFSPQDIGNYTQSIVILTDNASLTKTVQLKGEALGSNATFLYFTVEGERVSKIFLPDTFLFSRSSVEITVNNPTLKDITVEHVNVPKGFSVDQLSFTIPSQSSHTISVSFSPEIARLYSGYVQLTTSDGHLITLPVFGKGIDLKFSLPGSGAAKVVGEKMSSIPSLYAKPPGIAALEAIELFVYNLKSQVVKVDVHFFAPPDGAMFYKVLSSGDWVKLPSNWYDSATNTLHLILEDNGTYDLDPSPGIIDDPIVVAVKDTNVPPAESGNAGGGGGGGCSISGSPQAGFWGFVPVLISTLLLILFGRVKREA